MIDYNKDRFMDLLKKACDPGNHISISESDIPEGWVPLCTLTSARSGRTVEQWAESMGNETAQIEDVRALKALAVIWSDESLRVGDLAAIVYSLSAVNIVGRGILLDRVAGGNGMNITMFFYREDRK